MPIDQKLVSELCDPLVLAIYHELEESKIPTFVTGKAVTQVRLGQRPATVELVAGASMDRLRTFFPQSDSDFGSQVLFVGEDKRSHKHLVKLRPLPALNERNTEFAQQYFDSRPIRADAVLVRLFNGEVITHPKAERDFQKRVLRPVQSPRDYIASSGRGGLDLIRMAAQRSRCGFKLDKASLTAIRLQKESVKKIHPKVLRYELSEIMTGEEPAGGLLLLQESGIFEEIFPALAHSETLFQRMLSTFQDLSEKGQNGEVTAWATLALAAELATSNRQRVLSVLEELRFTAEKLGQIVSQMSRLIGESEEIPTPSAPVESYHISTQSPQGAFRLTGHHLRMWDVRPADVRRLLNLYEQLRPSERPPSLEAARAWALKTANQ